MQYQFLENFKILDGSENLGSNDMLCKSTRKHLNGKCDGTYEQIIKSQLKMEQTYTLRSMWKYWSWRACPLLTTLTTSGQFHTKNLWFQKLFKKQWKFIKTVLISSEVQIRTYCKTNNWVKQNEPRTSRTQRRKDG